MNIDRGNIHFVIACFCLEGGIYVNSVFITLDSTCYAIKFCLQKNRTQWHKEGDGMHMDHSYMNMGVKSSNE